jgi:hypothetical protein
MALFIETAAFTREITARLDDSAYADFQKRLSDRPRLGALIPGCGGLRKVRLPDPRRQKGKRGGARVIYLHIPEADWILLVDLYDKGEKEDLAPQEKKFLRRLAHQLKEQAIRVISKSRQNHE